MNYKVIVKVDNRELQNEIVDIDKLNATIDAFQRCTNIVWKDCDISLHIESTKEKSVSDEEFKRDKTRRILKIIFDNITKD